MLSHIRKNFLILFLKKRKLAFSCFNFWNLYFGISYIVYVFEKFCLETRKHWKQNAWKEHVTKQQAHAHGDYGVLIF